MANSYDFSGYVTRNDLPCSDGRTIRKNAFINNDGETVPLVWNHNHKEIDNVLGHCLLENRDDGVFGYATFNDSENGQIAKELVRHGDVRSLSIYANKLKHKGSDVVHGMIREVSLVLSGANPGAFIESVMAHSEDGSEDEEVGLIINYDENTLLVHSDEVHEEKVEESKEEPEEKTEESTETEEKTEEVELEHAEDAENQNNSETIEYVLKTLNEEQLGIVSFLIDEAINHNEASAKSMPDAKEGEKSINDVFNGLSEKQKNAIYHLVSEALKNKNSNNSNEKGETEMSHNAFENEEMNTTLTHSQMETIFKEAKGSRGSLKDSFLAHAEEYGIDNLEYLFPEDRNVDVPPSFISRDMDWVKEVMGSVNHSPFSRVKSMFANITEDEARAKGYIKGNLKKEEVFSLLKRSTSPTTVYKKQKMDRDDIIDITDFDVVAWIKKEMRMMLDEEIARAILIGDGRLASSDDKISELNIRPVVNDHDLFVIRYSVSGSGDTLTKNFVKAAIKARKNYKGAGRPVLFTTEDMLTDLLLLEDGLGYSLYKTEADLATKLRVSKIVTVPVLENFTDKDSKAVYGIIVNLRDYGVGADKGGAINMFDDFDIDYNQEKYLIETRCSGALRVPFSAIVLRAGDSTAAEKTVQEAIADFEQNQ